MCGIAGVIGIHGDLRVLGQRLLTTLRHRGPDDEGIEVLYGSLVLVHSRLAILDLTSAGHQPMKDSPTDGTQSNWVVFNGQIFNFQELQPELARLALPSRSSSDTEVLLNAYRAWGENCVDRFHGMFAFCLVDGDRRVAHLCRDRMGVKPLYVCDLPKGGLAFASEIRTLLALGSDLVPPHLDRGALESYLAQGAIQDYSTLVSGIGILEPGTWLTVDLETGRRLRARKYWDLRAAAQYKYKSRDEVVEHVSALARKTVRQQLISDVPLGLFLSGGIDSASLLAIAAESSTTAMRTLTVGFDVQSFDETSAAAVTASAFHCAHNTVRLSGEELLDLFPLVLDAIDHPTVDGTNTFMVARAARSLGLTVALSGLGGDELFGGYASFSDVPRAVRTRQWLGWTHAFAAVALRNHSRAGNKILEMMQRPPDLLQMYLLRRELFLPAERRSLQQLPEVSDPVSGVPMPMLEHVRAHVKGLDPFNATSLCELEIYMRHMLLPDADAFSMAAPLECRVPFLDHDLVQAVFDVPSAWKRNNGRPKPLLLDVVGSKLPPQVWQRPKQGFAFPWQEWLMPPSGALSAIALDAANDHDTWEQIGLNSASINNIWSRFSRADRSISALQILALVVLRDYVLRHKLRLA